MNIHIRRVGSWRRCSIVAIIFILFLLLVSLQMHHILGEVKTTTQLKQETPEQINYVQNKVMAELQQSDLPYQDEPASIDNDERIKRIKQTCSQYNLGNYKNNNTNRVKYPPTPQFSVFYYDLEDNFAFCPIYKSGSSTWLYNLCLLAGENEETLQNTKLQLSTIARRFFPDINDFEIAKEVLNKSIKLMVVRHPFERILSAYRDKLENINIGWEHGTGHFYRKYGAKIVRKYRPGGNRSVAVLKRGSFIWDKSKPKPAGIEPTFKEFVSYLLDTDLLNYADDHWIPYNLFCTPCLVEYDFVAKVETLVRDQAFIINKLGWKNRIQPRWRHKTNNEHTSSESISKAYFSQLSQQEVKLLYNKYKLDFDMFNYSPNSYVNYAKDE